MFKSFKMYWKDYWDMCIKSSCKWIRKHWKGYIIYNIIAITGTWAYVKHVLNKPLTKGSEE